MLRPCFFASFLLAATFSARAAAPVAVHQTSTTITLDNGIVALTINKKTCDATSLLYHPPTGAPLELGDGGKYVVYYDANVVPDKLSPEEQQKLPKAGYMHPRDCLKSLSVVTATPDMADVVADAGPSTFFPFRDKFHYVLRRGDSGFYLYEQVLHGPGMPAAKFDQTRVVIRAENKGAIFTNEIIDEDRKGPPPSSARVSMPQDATYRLADGTAYTKYDMSQFVSRFTAFGFAGHDTGLWFVWPSTEFCNGGPFKQELDVQIDNIMQAMFQGTHFGAAPIHVNDDESWSKVLGPVFVYVNHGGTPDDLWLNAQKQADVQKSQWPYAWLKSPDYPHDRGSVDGQLVLRTPAAASLPARDTWIILDTDEAGEQDADFAMRSRGYHFWTRTDANGRFHLDNLRPGHYTLFACGANQFEPFKQTGITIEPHQTTHLDTLSWQPITHGKQLWQIGIADRSTAEFHDGSPQTAYRNFDTFQKYFRDFPHDVNFTIGQSVEAKDWEYAQWGWYSEKPYWTINFDANAADLPPKGTATLTLGFASTEPAGDLLVNVNGKQIAKLTLPKSGTAGYRSGAQDSLYTVKYVPFDAALLHPGQNEITLGQSRAEKFSPALITTDMPRPKTDIMYDAIRLEVSPATP